MTARVYVENKESRESIYCCPACGSDECTLDDRDYCGREYVECYTCNACGQEFVEVYEYRQTEWTKEVRR